MMGNSMLFLIGDGDAEKLRKSAATLREMFAFPPVIRIVPGVFWRETNEKRAWVQAVRYIFKTVVRKKLGKKRRYWDYEDYCRFLGARDSDGEIEFESRGESILLLKNKIVID